MTVVLKRALVAGGGIATIMSGRGPKPFLAPETGAGGGATEPSEADKAAAEQAAADKAAADKVAADKAAADKAEADRKAQEEAEKNMSESEKEKSKLLREVMEKKGKLKETEEALLTANTELAKFKGIDLDKVKALLEAEKTREEKDLEAKGEYDRLKQRIAEEREAERKAWDEERNTLQGTIKTLSGDIDNLTVGQNFATSKFISEDLVLTPTKARVLYGAHFEMKDGKTVAYDKPAGVSGRTPLVDAGGDPLSFDAALRKIVEADPDKDSLMKTKMTPGAGSRHTNSGTQSQQEIAKRGDQLFGASRIAAGLAKGS